MKEEKHYYKFVSYTDGSGYCKGLRIKLLTPSEVEWKRKCGIIYERVDKKDEKEDKDETLCGRR